MASLQTFSAEIMGNKTYPLTLQLKQTPSKHCSDQVLRPFLLEFRTRASPMSLIAIGTLSKGAILRHSMEEPQPKGRNSRVMQVFGADGKVQSSRNREYDPPGQSRDKYSSRKTAHVLLPSLQSLPATPHLSARAGTAFWLALWPLTQLNAFSMS